MSSIQKLNIRGIRSFEEQTPESIEFFTPLTLVVGQNGCGKTTVIECLKYALTGQMPPNSTKGGAFIHDPSLTSVKEILAQVKLQFTSIQGHDLVVGRSLSLTIKNKARSMKTLDSNLRAKRHGETHNISSRVAELDLLLPQYLGVSAAVIDNVIFCHQEDSLWPLSESGTLKKKFDAIFEAEKYTKAIKNIKDIAKAKKLDLQIEKVQEEAAKGDKDRAVKAQKRSVELRDRVEELRNQCEELGRQMTTALDLAHKAHQDSEGYAQELARVEGKRIEARSKENTINDLKLSLKEVPESDEWLEDTLAEFDTRQQELRETVKTKQEKYVECTDHIKDLRKQLDVKLGSRGKFQEAKEEYDRQIIRRKTLVRETAAKHNIRGFDDLTDDSLVDDFLHRITKLSKDQQTALDRARREHDAEKREAQSQVNKLSEHKVALRNNRKAASQQIARNNQDANEYQRKVDVIKTDETSKVVAASRIDELTSKINKARTAANEADFEKKLREANTELRELEDNSSRLNNELVQGTKRAGEMARLAHVKQELKERERGLQTLLDAHTERINSIIGSAWEAHSVQQAHRDTLDKAVSDLASVERERDSAQRELEQISFKLKTIRDDLAKKAKYRDESEQKIRKAIDGEPSEYEQLLQGAQENAESARSSTKGSKELHDYLLSILEELETKECCRVCRRQYKKTAPKYAEFKARVESSINEQAQAAQQVETDGYEQRLSELLELRLTHETWKQLTETDIPTLQDQMKTLQEDRGSVVAKIEKRDTFVEERKQTKRKIESISKTIDSINKFNSDIESLQQQVEDLLAKQAQHPGGRTLEDIQEDISTAAEQKRKAQTVVTRLAMEQDQSKTDSSRMELELRDHKADLSSATFQLEKKASLMARVDEFRSLNEEQRKGIEKIDTEIQELEPQIETASTKYEDVVSRANAYERELSQEASRLTESTQNLDLLKDQIQSYLSRDGDKLLSQIDREIKNFEDEIANITSEQGRLARETNKINDQLKDSESTQRQYSDNLRYRRDTCALKQLTKEIEELATQNAEVDRDRLREVAEKQTREHNLLSARQSELMGEMKSKDAQLADILSEYKVDMMDAPKRYREAHIKVETTKAAVDDLNRYGQALDKAIMKYHGLKMDNINGIMEELWRATYQGTDVDTILIRAENDSPGAGKSYNYRVVMVKQGTEMDMRGRCSAGQKVLASIIIRLALAEVFSANCGLIALDEPTTNLDRPNIEALAKALHDIVRARQEQSNFQLIVITHDETFLKSMNCAAFADYYYRLDRDHTASSRIYRQSIAELT